MADSYEFDPVTAIAVGTVGVPGSRQFFLRAGGPGAAVVLNCEKAHVQSLVARIRQLLADDPDPVPGTPGQPPDAGEPAWSVAELGVGGPDKRGLFVIVARQLPLEGDEGEPANARFWASAAQLRDLAAQAEAVVEAGRPPCPRCGLPMDPGGHPCPASNGSRPIV